MAAAVKRLPEDRKWGEREKNKRKKRRERNKTLATLDALK